MPDDPRLSRPLWWLFLGGLLASWVWIEDSFQSPARLDRGRNWFVGPRLPGLALLLHTGDCVNLGDLGEFTRVLGCRHNAPEFSGSRSLVAMYGLLLGRIYPLAIGLALGLEVDQAIGFLGKLLGLAGEQIVFGVFKSVWMGELERLML